MRAPLLLFGPAVLIFAGPVAADPPAKTLIGLPLVFHDDFQTGRADRWEMSDPNAWKLVQQGDRHVLSQFQQSKVKTPVRSPFNRALVKDVTVGDFVLEVRLQSTARDYGHRDLCLFFGFQDPAHLYYAHLGKQADPHAHSIFLVNSAPRVSIAKTRTDGTPWDDAWHTVRVVRKVESGHIAVYFDDLDKPIMTAEDKQFTAGRVGVGSFDDTGNFADVRLWGTKVESPGK
jgi:hypothetical protein